MKCPTKEELLKHYSRREPTKFVQVDAWVNPPADGLIRPDKDGDWICSHDDFELMLGPSFIDGGGVRVLKKIARGIMTKGIPGTA